ncbi:MAG: 6-carboxytetrahydropterin synthase [Limnohabitans sp.]|jgi:6-pyruvoyltetrahydropterin/6-carboxytetrahydropterin synthase|nr:6-carboxytetrahydropterin synthase [Limnohabitans sp.]
MSLDNHGHQRNTLPHDEREPTAASMPDLRAAPLGKFAVEVECEFAAAHAILIGGVRERLHGHNWKVVVSVAGSQLDHEELLCDFHLVESMLHAVVAPFRDGNLNETPPFDRINPTAEAVAAHIATTLGKSLVVRIPSVQLEWVRVTEAPRCTAIFRCLSRASLD